MPASEASPRRRERPGSPTGWRPASTPMARPLAVRDQAVDGHRVPWARPHPAAACVAVAAVAALALTGCGMRRVLVIETNPPGARLTVNGYEHGTTPQRIRYMNDGLFTVRIEKEGYESIADEV